MGVYKEGACGQIRKPECLHIVFHGIVLCTEVLCCTLHYAHKMLESSSQLKCQQSITKASIHRKCHKGNKERVLSS